MIVIAVLRQNVHARLRHPAKHLSHLSRLTLIQFLNQDLILPNHRDARSFESASASRSIFHEKVGPSFAVDNEHTAALNADSCDSESLSHLSKGAGAIFQLNR